MPAVLRNRLRPEVFLVLAAGAAAVVAASGPGARSAGGRTVWATDGPVDAVAAGRDGTVYLGGEFTSVSTDSTSGFAAIGPDGRLQSSWPTAAGHVESVAADGHGGWYLGGHFEALGGTPVLNLAHVRADGTVDSNWRPQPNGDVNTLAVSRDGATLYVGGNFARVAGRRRSGLAALKAGSGAILPWNPGPAAPEDRNGPSIGALAASPDGSTIYVGGYFTAIGGRTRLILAAVDSKSGAALPWRPRATVSYVSTLLASPNGRTVYVGSQPGHLDAVDAQTGARTAPSVRLGPSFASVSTLALGKDRSTLYVGGDFTSIDGKAHSGVAAIDMRSRKTTSWDPTLAPTNTTALAVSPNGRTVYAGGLNFGGGNLVALDAKTGAAAGWNPDPNGFVFALAVRGRTVFAGGEFTGFGGVEHRSVAAIAPSGAISPWRGYAPGPVHALAPSSDGAVLYAAMQDTSWVRALRTGRTGAVWSAKPTGYVHAVALDPSGSTVYADGTPGIVAIDAKHGVIDPTWRPQPPPHNATSLAVTGTAVFAADSSVAAFDRKDGHRLWVAGASGLRGALALAFSRDGTRLYTGGAFVKIGGTRRQNIAALDPRTGAVLSWKASMPGLVHALVATGSTVYAGGEFGVASIDAATGAVKILDRPGEVLALALRADGSSLYAGGHFGLLRLSI
jgi:hypothetical protein